MKKVLCALGTLVVVALVSLGLDTSCANPDQLCRGTSINRRLVPNTTDPERSCTECVEGNCCDQIGDCQGTECANQVAETHACVMDAGIRATIREPECRDSLRTDQSRSVYQCMRDHCDQPCQLPTCRLDPLVPAIGNKPVCDQCFAQSCCPLMNECVKNRTCLLMLRCIVNECQRELSTELLESELSEAQSRRGVACGDGGAPPTSAGPPADPNSCFAKCVSDNFVENDAESAEARCLATRINECGAAVDCGKSCAPDTPADSGSGAPDAPAD